MTQKALYSKVFFLKLLIVSLLSFFDKQFFYFSFKKIIKIRPSFFPTNNKFNFLVLLLSLVFSNSIFSQNACNTCSNVPSFTVNLSNNPNNSYTVSSQRNNKCCQGSGSDNCVVFYVTVHPSASEIKFFKSGGNNGTYQINCQAPSYNPTAPVCLSGLQQFCITYCNPGNNNDTYTITTSAGFSVSPNFSVNAGCTAKMYVSGLTTSSTSPTWNSIFPGTSGQYNSFLSCAAGCDTTYVTPASGAPTFIDYLVCGQKAGCTTGNYCDTVRVYTTPSLSISFTPTNAVVCLPATSIALTGSVSGGVPPYTFTWTPGGALTQSISATVGNYTFTVKDGSTGCPIKTSTISVTAGTVPAAPIPGSNSPLCVGQTLSLTSSAVPGATLYSWTGPNSFTSSVQNPNIVAASLVNSGNYFVKANVGGCESSLASVSVTISNAPLAPTAGSNGPLCAGQTLSLTASTIASATYSWTGPNSFTSTTQNPIIAGTTTLASGVYSVNATVGGCSGPISTVSVLINPIPASPTAGSNSPLCAGQTLSLSASTIAGATYSWTGPNSFTSTTQNPSLDGTTILSSGVYSVGAMLAGCLGPNATVSVLINPIPASPTAGSNSPLCVGQTLSLTASTIVGATYSWAGPNTFTSAAQNPSVIVGTTLAGGVYSVNATIGGCKGSNGTVSVFINPIPAAPTAGSNSPLCAGQTISLTASTIAGATYSWTGPNSFTSTQVVLPLLTKIQV